MSEKTKIKPVIVFDNDDHLVSLINGFGGYSMATLDITTLPKCTVKSRKDKELKFADVFSGEFYCTKHQFIGIGYEYSKSLNNKLEKQDMAPVATGELPWGKWHNGSKIIIEHNGRFYLRITYLNANQQYSEKYYHYANGEEISEYSKSELDNFLPVKKDTVLLVNSVKVSGIIKVVFDGTIYVRKGFLDEQDKNALNTWVDAVAISDDEAFESEIA